MKCIIHRIIFTLLVVFTAISIPNEGTRVNSQQARVWDYQFVSSLSWSPTGQWIARAWFRSEQDATSGESLLQIIDPSNYQPPIVIFQWEETAPINGMAWSADGTILLVAHQTGTINLFRTDTWQLTQTLDVFPILVAPVLVIDTIKTISTNPSRTQIALGSARGVIEIRSLTDLQLINSTRIPENGNEYAAAIEWIGWNSDGSLLATAGRDGKVRLYDPETLSTIQVLDNFRGIQLHSGDWHHENGQLAIGTENGFIDIWDTTTNNLVNTIEIRRGSVLLVEWIGDTEIISSYGKYGVADWNSATGQLITTYPTTKTVLTWDIGPSGQLIVGTSIDPLLDITTASLISVTLPINTPPPTPTDPSPTDTPPTSTPPSSSTPPASPTSGPSATPTPPAPPTSTPPASPLAFQRGINFGGDALSIEGNVWEAGASAPNFSSNGWTQCNPWVALMPTVSVDRTDQSVLFRASDELSCTVNGIQTIQSLGPEWLTGRWIRTIEDLITQMRES
jgi:WD40 repeat protein